MKKKKKKNERKHVYFFFTAEVISSRKKNEVISSMSFLLCSDREGKMVNTLINETHCPYVYQTKYLTQVLLVALFSLV